MAEALKFPRTIRLDASDVHVFAHAAEPGEWAVPGSFAYSNVESDALAGKERRAFVSGWLGTASFGRSTFVQVASVTYEELDAIVERLAGHFVAAYGAPDLAAALPAAQEETRYAISLCDHDPGTLLAIARVFTENGIAERVRVVMPKSERLHARIWGIVADGE